MIKRFARQDVRQQIYLGLGQLAAHGSIVYVLLRPSGIGLASSFLVYFFMAGAGISMTAHRFLTHRSFTMPRAFELCGSLFMILSLQGSTIAWVSMHREHHRFADQRKDPHNPSENFWTVHFFSMFYTPKLKYVLDLLKDPMHRHLHRWYWPLNLTYGVALFALNGLGGLVYFYLLPAAMTWQGIGLAKTVAHRWGYRNFEIGDSSRNLPLLGYLTFGEGWHNNHHAFPKRWSFKRRWYEWDFSAFLIWVGIRHFNFKSLQD